MGKLDQPNSALRRKKNAVARYTLPENENQTFASIYKLYLPSEAENAAEIKSEQEKLRLLTTDKKRFA